MAQPPRSDIPGQPCGRRDWEKPVTDITGLPNRQEPCHRNPDGSARITHGDSLQDLAKRERRIVEVASRCFAIGTVRRTARLTGGVLNEVYLAETSRDRFVVRVNRVRRSMSEIERLSSFLSYLSLRGIPVDGLVPAADGQVAAEIDGELLSVHRYITGAVYPSPQDLKGTQTANMMTFLADYHSAAGGYRIAGRLAARDEMLPVKYTDDTNTLRERFESLPKTTRVGRIHRQRRHRPAGLVLCLQAIQGTRTNLDPRRL